MQYYDVFVYGTLRKGGTNHAYLENAHCLRENVWLNGFVLYDYQHAYPFMLPASEAAKVKGEIYRVDAACLQALNVLEDVENYLYRLVFLEKPGCYTYLKYDNDTAGLGVIRSGDWISYIARVNQA